ncbi:MAG: NAD(P)-dependent alcohol dehydrogenase [Acidimicrobiales bacterium]
MTDTPTTPPQGRTDDKLPDTMLAVVQDRYGGPETLDVRPVDVPRPGTGEVLVQVLAAGLDRGQWHLMSGLPYLVRLGFGLRRPKQPVRGLDLAGRVVAVGPGTSRFSVGDEVFGIGAGSFAEYAVAPEAKLAAKPATVTWEQAAAAPVSGITALQAVRHHGRVQAGQRVLVLGASGGVGTFAVQMAKAAGATVTGVASGAKADLVRSIGADRVLDYRRDEVLADRYDVIVDLGGRRPLRALRKALTERGTLVIVGGEGGNRLTGGFGRSLRAPLLSKFVPQRLTMFISPERTGDIAEVGRMLAAGELVSVIDGVHPLTEAAAVFRAMTEGRVGGKAVIQPTTTT